MALWTADAALRLRSSDVRPTLTGFPPNRSRFADGKNDTNIAQSEFARSSNAIEGRRKTFRCNPNHESVFAPFPGNPKLPASSNKSYLSEGRLADFETPLQTANTRLLRA